ncbi:hypothetical protein SAMN05444365_101460 [Micromonospora pattaloongensis]|uniref:Uncharacterized protein n=1 Tax=Micromonospora pattaloongensis TaxID=405436 RepID=A0A1H3GKU4_9ACTN|nr:hypothetical protein [Micromonospora pattaloongensis]SDY03943.1 hypothetical protein SAMN05444365_101460 [Micromonospora pattaloongensis]
MTLIVGLLRRIVSRYFPSLPAAPDIGQRIQAGEQEAARRRLLDQARGRQQRSSADGEPLTPDSGARFSEHGE